MSEPNWDVLDRIMQKYYPQKWKRLKEQYGKTEGEQNAEEKKDVEKRPRRKRRKVHSDNF